MAQEGSTPIGDPPKQRHRITFRDLPLIGQR